MSVEGTTWAIIAGGGTAGHVHPALAIGEELVRRGHDRSSIHYVGSRRGIEAELVPEAGFDVTLLPGRGIQRRLTLENVSAGVGLGAGLATAMKEMAKRRPAIVAAMGGYASVPCAVAAAVQRVPLVVAEQNAVPGAANRLAARWARAAAVSFAATPLPRAVLTGNPVRPEVLAVDRERDRYSARDRLGVARDDVLVAVFGGSLGAARINEAAFFAATQWASREGLAVRHIVGRRDWSAMAEQRRRLNGSVSGYVPVEYEHDMPSVLAAADLAVCRAGASTVAELTVIGTPSVLIPFPHATADHQSVNAAALADLGAAVVIADHELTGERLVAEVDAVLQSAGRLESMSRAARSIGRPDAAARVADLIEQHARA